MQEAAAAPRPAVQQQALEQALSAQRIALGLFAFVRAHSAALVFCAAVALGLSVRLVHLLSVDFPLNDGGMFYVMARDIQEHGYAVPSHTSYNSGDIPFAYPYLPFYLAAVLDQIGPWSLIEVIRFLPLVANLLTIGALFLLARRLLPNRLSAGIAVLVFVLLPRSYEWMIMGGGLTRSFGFLFVLLALHQLLLLYRQPGRRLLITATSCATLAVLSHPEAAWVLAFSAALLLLCYGRDRAALRNSFLAAGGVLVLSAPWWATVLAQNGLSPLVSAVGTGGNTWNAHLAFYSWRFTEQPYLNWPAMLAILGGLVALSRGKAFLPLWLFAIVVLEPRSAPTYAAAPIALLAAFCIDGLVLPIWNGALAPQAASPTDAPRIGSLSWPAFLPSPQTLVARGAVVLFLIYIGIIALESAYYPLPALRGLSAEDRNAMAWVAENTDEDATFLVLTGEPNAWTDRTAEWFPALTGRESVATLQGYEWMGRDAFDRQRAGAGAVQRCADVYCMERWLRTQDLEADYVYLTQTCCTALRLSLQTSIDYRLVHYDRGALVFALLHDGHAAGTWPQLGGG